MKIARGEMGNLLGLCVAYALATVTLNVSPITVGVLITGLFFSEQLAGGVVSLEFLMMACTTFLLSPWGRHWNIRTLLIIGVLLVLVANTLLAVFQTIPFVITFRGLAGVGEGLLLLAFNIRVAQSADPVRLYGAGTLISTLVGAMMLVLLPTIFSAGGVSWFFLALGLLVLLALPMLIKVRTVPNPLAEIAISNQTGVGRGRVCLALFGLMIIQLSQAGFWGFVERRFGAVGVSIDEVGGILASVYLLSILGALLATWLGNRKGAAVPLTIGLSLHAGSIVLFCTTEDVSVAITAMAIQSFSYFFVIPYQLGFVAGLDQSGKLAAWGAGAFFFGLAIGPFVGASLLVHFGYIGIACSVVFTVALALILFLSILYHVKQQSASEQDAVVC